MPKRRKPVPPPPEPTRGTAPMPAPVSRWAGVFVIDARSLAAFRIGLGLWLLLDLALRAADLTAHYTDAGVLPRIPRIGLYDLPDGSDRKHWLSLLMMAGDPWQVRAFFAVAAAAATLLVVGYRTPVAAVACYVLNCSLQSRTPPVGDGGDSLIRVLLFWGLFLPLGGRFSLDVRLGRRPPTADRVCNLATFALLTQVGFVYLFGAADKNDPVWHTHHTALYYALSADVFATDFGRWLVGHGGLTRPLTLAAWLLEWFGPLLLLIPLRTGWLRLGAVLAFWGFHLGTAATLHLGLFPLAGCVAWLPFLPALVWERGRVPGRPAGEPARLGRWAWFVGVVWVYVLLWNLREVNPWWERVLPQHLNAAGRVLRVDQNWSLFAPKPMTDDGWWVMRGTLADGTTVNLWADGPLTEDRPADVAATYVNTRWRKYLLNLKTSSHEAQRVDFATWLARRWEDAHPGRPGVDQVELVYMLEETPPPGNSVPPAVPVTVFASGRGRPPEVPLEPAR